MLSHVATARDKGLEVGRWAVLMCLFSVPINKPATNISIVLALVCAVLGGRALERFRNAIRQPVVIGALLWFLALFFSALIVSPGAEGLAALGPYKALLYPLIVAMLLDTRQWRDRALFSFGLSVTLILLTSWAQFLIAIPGGDFARTTTVDSFTVFKNYTQQGLAFLVLAALAACFANVEQDGKRKRILWFVAGAAFINVIYLLQSRTAYLIAAPLLLYWGWRLLSRQRSRWRGAVIALLLLAVVGTAAMLTPRFQQRIVQAKEDVSLYSTQNAPTSMGVRLELWKRTLPMIASAPLFGHGLGQWKEEFLKQVKEPGYNPGFLMGHPHQEALQILAEQGVVGFALFVLALVMLAMTIRRLEPPYRDFYSCLLLIYVTAGLANCILADFSHRHIFLMLLACIPVAPAMARARALGVPA
ncbi:MAG: O-antigen ligase family protein [Pseudomonadota bacterium]